MPVPFLLWVAGGAAGAAAVKWLRAPRLPDDVESSVRQVQKAAETVANARQVAEPWRRLLDHRSELGRAVDTWVDKEDPAKVASQLRGEIDTRLDIALERVCQTRHDTLFGEVLLIGLTGVGKSTLLNAALGREVAVVGVGPPQTKGVERHRSADGWATLVDTEGIESRGAAALEQRGDRLAVLALLADVVWYCIQAETGRLQPAELDLIDRLGESAPLVVVLTRALEPPCALRRELDRHGVDYETVDVLAKDRSVGSVVVAARGVNELLVANVRVMRRHYLPTPVAASQ